MANLFFPVSATQGKDQGALGHFRLDADGPQDRRGLQGLGGAGGTGVAIDPLAAQPENQGLAFNAFKAETGMPRQSLFRMAGIQDVGNTLPDSGDQQIP